MHSVYLLNDMWKAFSLMFHASTNHILQEGQRIGKHVKHIQNLNFESLTIEELSLNAKEPLHFVFFIIRFTDQPT